MGRHWFNFALCAGRVPLRIRRGFTLIEILIVVVILGILGAIVLPKFSDASHSARVNTLKDDLRYLRTQVVVFKAQHKDVAPGYPGGNLAATPTASAFQEQMTRTSNVQGGVGTGAAYKFGPYLTKMPPNPINGLATVKIVENGSALPAPDDTTGWIFKPQTLEIIPNSTGVDSDGVAYKDY